MGVHSTPSPGRLPQAAAGAAAPTPAGVATAICLPLPHSASAAIQNVAPASQHALAGTSPWALGHGC